MDNTAMTRYITAIYQVCRQISTYATQHPNQPRLKIVSIIVYKYAHAMAKTHGIDLRTLALPPLEEKGEPMATSLAPIVEYITQHRIELYDTRTISENAVDTSNPKDVERYVLSQIYYITQQRQIL